MYIAGIGQAVLELLSFEVGSGNHQRGISLLQSMRQVIHVVLISKNIFP